MHVRQLPASLKPLAEKFYRSQRAVMGNTADAQIWVVEKHEIIAALVLHPVADGHWLTSLLVTHAHRNQGIARQFIATVQATCASKIWLFCQPQLCSFYTRQGFTLCHELPQPLAARLARYQQRKPLCAMQRHQ